MFAAFLGIVPQFLDQQPVLLGVAGAAARAGDGAIDDLPAIDPHERFRRGPDDRVRRRPKIDHVRRRIDFRSAA